MKKGTFIINPYVSPYYKNVPNPMYRTIFWRKEDIYAECITYENKIIKYYYSDVIKWKQDGIANLDTTYLKLVFGINDNQWVNVPVNINKE